MGSIAGSGVLAIAGAGVSAMAGEVGTPQNHAKQYNSEGPLEEEDHTVRSDLAGSLGPRSGLGIFSTSF